MNIPPMEDFFGPEGRLKDFFPKFEHRRGQADLAEEVRKTLLNEAGECMAAEAPPGVGKTFALLIPAMLAAAGEGKKILFLTAGIPLQEQLIKKDLPDLNKILGLSLPFGLLKGKGNYACLLRVEEAGLNRGEYLAFGDGGAASMAIAQWLKATATGDLSEVSLAPDNPALLRVSASSRSCLGAKCPFKDRCFSRQALKEAQNWSVTVANYHLYFSYLLGVQTPFPVRADILICDEAHRIAEAARSSMAVSVGAEDFAGLLRHRVITEGAHHLERGSGAGKIAALSGEIREESARFFNLLESKTAGKKALITEPSEELMRQQQIVSDKVFDLLKIFAPLTEELEQPDPLQAAASVWAQDLRRARSALEWCSEVKEYPSWAYWREGKGLASAPAAPFEELAGCFNSPAFESRFFVSATLTVGKKWDYWLRETGVEPNRFFVADSPFDLPSQMEIVVVDTGMDVMNPRYDDTVCAVIEKLVEANGGSTLVLLSSMRLLGKAAQILRGKVRDYAVLVQGELPRSELLQKFREDKKSVLVGSASFREGVDVPGEGLTQVIIDRIPFSHPGDPIVAARNALEGRAAFSRTALPEAKMVLKQAAGRLIRSGDDRGRVVIIDGRVLRRKDWNIPAALPPVKYRRLIISSGEGRKSVAPASRV